ncbi:MAG: hypothetical protein Q8K60_01735 [Parachlamydiaceae bacterium]|nr:hypothetical protein [Parachlamydiaceae bacterium]
MITSSVPRKILNYANEMMIIGKNWNNFFGDVISLLKRENPYELLKKLENVKDVEGYVKIANAFPYLMDGDIYDIQKTCGAFSRYLDQMVSFFPQAGLDEMQKFLGGLNFNEKLFFDFTKV